MYTVVLIILNIALLVGCIVWLLGEHKTKKRFQRLFTFAKEIERGEAERSIPNASEPQEGEFIATLNRISRMIMRKDRALTKSKQIRKFEAHFLSVVRHQLRNPLTIIRWTLQTLRADERCTESRDNKILLHESFKATEKMLELLDDFLGSAKISPYAMTLTRRRIVIQKLVEKILAKYKESIEEKKLAVRTNFNLNSAAAIVADKFLLYEAFRHLISNAISYTPNEGAITLSLAMDNDHILFTIADTGIGIKKEDAKKIYLKFYRGKNAIKMKPGSSGLGLFVANAVIKAHKGKLWFESAINQGTTFFVRLPQK